MQIAGLVLTFCVLLNAAFYFLSDMYFADRVGRFGAGELEAVGAVRIAFAMFSLSVAVGSVLASFAPSVIGHGIAGAAGLGSLIGGALAISRGLPPVLGVTMIVLGGLFPVLVWRSLARSRAGWAFLIALCAVYALVLLFGAPKVRGLLGIGLWHALIIPGLLAVGAAALGMLRERYRDLEAKPKRAAAPPPPPPPEELEPEERARRRKNGLATMVVGLVFIFSGGVLVATVGVRFGMAGAGAGFAMVAVGIALIARGYLSVPR
jgi:hypothetical protein